METLALETSKIRNGIVSRLNEYCAKIQRNLTQKSIDDIVAVMEIFYEDPLHFDSYEGELHVLGNGDKGIILKSSKCGIVFKIQIEWEGEAKEIKSQLERTISWEFYVHSIADGAIWSLYEDYPGTSQYRIPMLYPYTTYTDMLNDTDPYKTHDEETISKKRSILQSTGTLILEEVSGKSLHFYAFIYHLRKKYPQKYQAHFPNGAEDYESYNSVEELGALCGIKNVVNWLNDEFGVDNYDVSKVIEILCGKVGLKKVEHFIGLFKSGTGIRHNDLHPGNFMVSKEPTEDNFEDLIFYIIDFGKAEIHYQKARNAEDRGNKNRKKMHGLYPIF